jgi:hypothetical protein
MTINKSSNRKKILLLDSDNSQKNTGYFSHRYSDRYQKKYQNKTIKINNLYTGLNCCILVFPLMTVTALVTKISSIFCELSLSNKRIYPYLNFFFVALTLHQNNP